LNYKNISIPQPVSFQLPGLGTQIKQDYCDSFWSAPTTLSNTDLFLVVWISTGHPRDICTNNRAYVASYPRQEYIILCASLHVKGIS